MFVHALPNIEPERSEVRQPPPRLANLLPLIRPHEHMPDSVRRLLATLTRREPKQSGADDVKGFETGRAVGSSTVWRMV